MCLIRSFPVMWQSFLMEMGGGRSSGEENEPMDIRSARQMSSLQEEIKVCEKDTANNDGLILNVAINYGGRMELVNAVRDISQKVAEGRMKADSVTEETITNHLYPSASSDVDLLIRTGGESRISNFLLWQVSYSELYFTPVLWPDFSSEELEKAVFWFTGRDRRFGGLTEASR